MTIAESVSPDNPYMAAVQVLRAGGCRCALRWNGAEPVPALTCERDGTTGRCLLAGALLVIGADVCTPCRPDGPPNRLISKVSPFGLCFWLPCAFEWRQVNRSWRQEVCTRCGITGRSEMVAG